jgi:hypothetical protein
MKYDVLYEFTPIGLNAFERIFKGQLGEDAIDLTDPAIVRRVTGSGALEITDFTTAKDMAQAVLKAIGQDKIMSALPNTGLWAWLTFVLRDQLFPKDKSGKRKIGEIHRWYPSNPNDWQKGQRHLVRMPVLLLASLQENADHLLCGETSVLPEIREQLTSQQDMFSPAFQAIARALYFDPSKGSLRRGAGGKGKGTPRRLARVRLQLDVTWELNDLEFARIMNTLPEEFNRFKESA